MSTVDCKTLVMALFHTEGGMTFIKINILLSIKLADINLELEFFNYSHLKHDFSYMTYSRFFFSLICSPKFRMNFSRSPTVS